jgi:hypothetical protein
MTCWSSGGRRERLGWLVAGRIHTAAALRDGKALACTQVEEGSHESRGAQEEVKVLGRTFASRRFDLTSHAWHLSTLSPTAFAYIHSEHLSSSVRPATRTMHIHLLLSSTQGFVLPL